RPARTLGPRRRSGCGPRARGHPESRAARLEPTRERPSLAQARDVTGPAASLLPGGARLCPESGLHRASQPRRSPRSVDGPRGGPAARFGPDGEIMPEPEFLGLLALSDQFRLLGLECDLAEQAEDALGVQPRV